VKRENPADRQMELILKGVSGVSEKIAQRLKGTRPFATEDIPVPMRIWAIDNLGYEDMKELQAEYDPQAINQILGDIEKLRQRRMK